MVFIKFTSTTPSSCLLGAALIKSGPENNFSIPGFFTKLSLNSQVCHEHRLNANTGRQITTRNRPCNLIWTTSIRQTILEAAKVQATTRLEKTSPRPAIYLWNLNNLGRRICGIALKCSPLSSSQPFVLFLRNDFVQIILVRINEVTADSSGEKVRRKLSIIYPPWTHFLKDVLHSVPEFTRSLNPHSPG